MKLASARVDAFLRRPDPEIRAVLLYGPDAGLVRERADALGRTVSEDLRDPFRVADLTGAAIAADPARLFDEAAQISLMGGRRLVRVREAGDAQSQAFARFLADPPSDGLVVVEGGDLPGRSSLRRAFDDAPRGVTIGCYPDSARDLAEVIRESLAAHRITASRDAVEFLVAHLGGDRLLTRSELEKLALYAGDGGRVELDDARVSIADSAALSLDDAVLAAAEGDAAALDRALGRVFQEGESRSRWCVRRCGMCSGCTRWRRASPPANRPMPRCAAPAHRSFSSSRIRSAASCGNGASRSCAASSTRSPTPRRRSRLPACPPKPCAAPRCSRWPR